MKTERINDYLLTYDNSPEAKDHLYAACLEWFTDMEHYSGESICQSDEPQIQAPVFLGDIAEDIFKFQQRYDGEPGQDTAHHSCHITDIRSIGDILASHAQLVKALEKLLPDCEAVIDMHSGGKPVYVHSVEVAKQTLSTAKAALARQCQDLHSSYVLSPPVDQHKTDPVSTKPTFVSRS